MSLSAVFPTAWMHIPSICLLRWCANCFVSLLTMPARNHSFEYARDVCGRFLVRTRALPIRGTDILTHCESLPVPISVASFDKMALFVHCQGFVTKEMNAVVLWWIAGTLRPPFVISVFFQLICVLWYALLGWVGKSVHLGRAENQHPLSCVTALLPPLHSYTRVRPFVNSICQFIILRFLFLPWMLSSNLITCGYVESFVAVARRVTECVQVRFGLSGLRVTG